MITDEQIRAITEEMITNPNSWPCVTHLPLKSWDHKPGAFPRLARITRADLETFTVHEEFVDGSADSKPIQYGTIGALLKVWRVD